MARNIDINSPNGTTPNLDAAQANGSYLVTAVEMIIDPDDADMQLRFTDLYRDVTFANFTNNTETFSGAGHLLGLSTVSESLDAKQNSIDITLAGLDVNVVRQITETRFIGSPMTIYRGYWNEADGTFVARPYTVWRGITNDYTVNYMGSLGQPNRVGVTVSCKNLLVSILESVNGRFTSMQAFQADQVRQGLTGNDRSMEFTPSLTSFNPSFGKED